MSQATPDPMDILRNLWSSKGFSLPGIVVPTIDTGELEQRITDMKAVEGWLRSNLSILQITIQSLEMQSATLAAAKAMSQSLAEDGQKQGDTPDGGTATSAMWPWNFMPQIQAGKPDAATAKPAEDAATNKTKPAAGAGKPKKALKPTSPGSER